MLTLDRVSLRQGGFALSADWTLPPEALSAVIGPSGGGKSTLLAVMAGFLTPVTGRVLWQGTDITQTVPGDRPVSMLFQDNNMFPHLTIAQNVGLGIAPRLKLRPQDALAVEAVLDKVGLGGMGDRKPASLSGGQQSRAALARVLVADRPVVLLDEPFAALGPALKQEMLNLVHALLIGQGKTVAMVTHSPEDARDQADHVILVADGVATAPVATETFFANPPEAFTRYTG